MKLRWWTPPQSKLLLDLRFHGQGSAIFAGRGIDRDSAQVRMLNLKVSRGATTGDASWPE